MAGIFRDRAVAGRAASEVTDRPVRVATAPAWAALALAVILLVLLAVWLFAGTVTLTTQGYGVIDNVPANVVVTSQSAGVLRQAPPPVGTRVAAGETVAVIGGDDPQTPALPGSAPGSGSTTVAAPIAGTVVAVGPGWGSSVAAGVPLATIAPETTDQIGYLFIPVAPTLQAHPGSAVNFNVDTVDPTGDGLLQGTVRSVSPLPVDESRIAYLTANAELTSQILASGPVVEVQVALTADPGTPSGWRWTLPPGPSHRITSGTPAHGTVILSQVRPYKAFLGSP
ncbi:MAG: HlyD family efflux transporter periplasmic adaptor subunit [Actinobacteria bacterium]|nr:MAG: HlyD family efflux transporter periplasmic adaptor subunit [Actinomycetota bacterium]